MADPNDLVFQAAAFAARAHKNQFRKDQETPYFSHPVRVCLVVRQVFGFDDPRMLAAALLHDVIEDTNTDWDDLIEKFGQTVADWVAALSKDKRLPHDPREEDYARRLAEADWPVKVVKLADLYDNLTDSVNTSESQQKNTVEKSHFYLKAVSVGLPDGPAQAAFQLVEQRLARVESRLTK
jgi:guanosine-3',5'-bis(diphosphate) 3'-pyrophosphohydrolase